MRAHLDRRSLILGRFAHRLGAQTPAARLARFREKLAGLGARLPGLAGRQIKNHQQGMLHLSQRLARAMNGRIVLARRDAGRGEADLAKLRLRLKPAMDQRILREKKALATRWQLLASLGHENVLARGFSIIRDETNQILRKAASVGAGQALSIQFADGQVGAIANGEGAGRPPETPKPVEAFKPIRTARPKPPEGGQGSLF